MGAFIPQCDKKGNYQPQQCHDSTGHCWCVNAIGEKIDGTNSPPGETTPTCEQHELTKCWKERQEALNMKLIGRFVPRCDGKGNYHPKQCHASTGHCWCVNPSGEKIEGTNTPPGGTPPTCEQHDSHTCHYAIAVVKKSSTFQFNQLQGKRSCHSGVSKTDGWIAPINVLVENKLLPWDGPAKESIEKAFSKFFSVSCIPGSSESNLCDRCKGEGDKKCRKSHDEPYYGEHGALRCLQEDDGDVAFLKSTALSDEHSGVYELLCPDNTRKPLNKYQECNLGKVPADAVVTREVGDKTKDINDFLLEAQKKQCTLFSSAHGKDLMFDDSTTRLALLPSKVDTFFFLGGKWYNAMNALSSDLQLPSKNKVRWCTINEPERMKCEDWSAVSGGAIACTEASSQENCIKQILKGEADAVKPDLQNTYEALKCGLMISVEEYHNNDDFGPCRNPGSEIKEFVTDEAVALVKKSNKDINWNNLKGKKCCHTGVGHIADWIIPFGLISHQNDICDMGSFFAESCVPGSDANSTLCKLCIGDPENPMANTKCSLSDKEAYYGPEGAIRCLVEAGDVAFVLHTAIFANTDGKNPAEWAKNLKSEDFELLCLDGSRAPVSNYKTCKLSVMPGGAIVTREESVIDVVRIALNQQSLFGRKGFQKHMFQLFSSNKGLNLLFNDDTQCLLEFDRQPKDIIEDYFDKYFYIAEKRINKCAKPSDLSLAALKTRHIGWCVTSISEYKKCKALIRSCKAPDLSLICLQKPSIEDCFTAIKDGEADAISVDSGNVFKASLNPYNLKPIMAESYGSQKDTCYTAVALVRKSSTFKFNELKNKRSCHTGIGHMAGWYVPLSVLREKKLLNWTEDEAQRAVSRFFSASCVPGAQEPNLCKNCAGWEGKKCILSNDEPYYNCHGAFKCLRDNKGDVAFVTHMAVPADLQRNFQLLCPDNTRRPVSQFKKCSLSRIPANAIVTRNEGDKTKYIVDFLQYSQKKECNLFSSKYGKNLLFKDSTQNIVPLPPSMDAFLYLGAHLYNSIKQTFEVSQQSQETLRWCTQSRQEKKKCDNWAPVSGGIIECTEASTADECIQQIMKGEADAVTLDGGYMYTAGQCGLVPVFGEYYNQDDLKPCQTSGSKTQGTYYAVAVVKKSNKDVTWNNLKGKKSCHTAVGRTAGWNIPVGLINKKNNNCDIGSYFSQSCAPGSDINSNLCQLCIGDPHKPLLNTRCSPSDAETYYGYSGALRCLVEKGEVAFVKHTTVFENTEGRNPALWAKMLKPNDFELLCPDGSRASVTDYKTCNLAEVPAHAVVSRPDKRSSVVRIVTKQQALFGRNGSQRQNFQLFGSKEGKDLLFKDSTQCLLEVDQKTTMEDFLGKSYFSAVLTLNKCSTTSELLSACTFHSC